MTQIREVVDANKLTELYKLKKKLEAKIKEQEKQEAK